MIRRQIQVDEQQWGALMKVATAQGVSAAELVRQGIRHVLKQTKTREQLWQDASELVGSIHDEPDVSERHDDYLAEAYAHDLR
jgi:hypothetical protein